MRDILFQWRCPAIATRGRRRHRPAVILTDQSQLRGTPFSGRSLHTMGLGCLRFMPCGLLPPQVVRSGIAPSVIAPPNGRRPLFKTRTLSTPIVLVRVTIGSPGGGGDDRSCGVPRISLRREAGKLRATEGGANAYPSLCVSSFRHALSFRSEHVPIQRIHLTTEEKDDERRR